MRSRRLALTAAAALFWCQGALAASSWSNLAFRVSPADAPKLVAAMQALMSSPIGKESPGRVILQSNIADGDDPATHSIVPIYASVADREAFVAKLFADPAWQQWIRSTSGIIESTASTRYRVVARWGDVSDKDVVWQTFTFAVADPVSFGNSLEAFMTSKTGRRFPGQLYLSQIVAAGINPASHVVSVGFESEAEMEAWRDSLVENADWQLQLEELQHVSELLGSSVARTIQAWGKPLKNVSAP